MFIFGGCIKSSLGKLVLDNLFLIVFIVGLISFTRGIARFAIPRIRKLPDKKLEKLENILSPNKLYDNNAKMFNKLNFYAIMLS